jgi:hypothetical protein
MQNFKVKQSIMNVMRINDQCRIWGSQSSGYEEFYLLGCKLTDISEEHVASIFKLEEKAEHETNMKVGGTHSSTCL